MENGNVEKTKTLINKSFNLIIFIINFFNEFKNNNSLIIKGALIQFLIF